MENSRIIGRIDLTQFIRQPIMAAVVEEKPSAVSGFVRGTARGVGIARGALQPATTPRPGRCACGAYLAKKDTDHVKAGQCPNLQHHKK